MTDSNFSDGALVIFPVSPWQKDDYVHIPIILHFLNQTMAGFRYGFLYFIHKSKLKLCHIIYIYSSQHSYVNCLAGASTARRLKSAYQVILLEQ